MTPGRFERNGEGSVGDWIPMVKMAKMAFVACALVACRGRAAAAAAGGVARATASAEGPSEACWKKLLHAGATVEQHVSADLDGDGVPEAVVLSSTVDPDLVNTPGVTQDEIRSNLNLQLEVFLKRDGTCVELEGPTMTGRLVPLTVSALKGGGMRRFIVASALHCGGSCAGIELHVVTVHDGKLVNLLDRDSIEDGEVSVSAAGELTVREAVYNRGRLTAHAVTKYGVQGDTLAVASRSEVPAH